MTTSQKPIFLQGLKYIPFYAIAALPFSVLYTVSDFLRLVIAKILKYRKRVILQNLTDSFPEKSKSEIESIANRYYGHLCDSVIESIKRLTIRDSVVRNRLTLKNPELVEKYIQENRNIIFYAAHQGNWEWLTFLPLSFRSESLSFYRKLNNGYFNVLVNRMRSRFGVKLVEERNAFRSILKYKEVHSNIMCCLIGDQRPRGNSSKIWVDFLERPTPFYVGAAKLAKKLDAVILFPSFTKNRRGYYSLEFELISEHPSKESDTVITQKYSRSLENAIRRNPALWLWSHNRWKSSKKE